MRVLKKVLLIVGVLALIIVGFLAYMGYFSNIEVKEGEEGGYIVAGMEVTGPYSKAGQHITEVDKKLKEIGVVSVKGFGIYYDDPATTPPEKCRSLVGNILEKKDLEKVKDIEQKELKIDSIPVAKAVIAEFPTKNTISYMIGPMKVYPALSEYIRKKNYKVALSFEIYNSAENKILYVMQVTGF